MFEVLLAQPHVRSAPLLHVFVSDFAEVAVFEPRGTGLESSRVGVRHLLGDPNLEITYKVRIFMISSCVFMHFGSFWIILVAGMGPHLQAGRVKALESAATVSGRPCRARTSGETGAS